MPAADGLLLLVQLALSAALAVCLIGLGRLVCARVGHPVPVDLTGPLTVLALAVSAGRLLGPAGEPMVPGGPWALGVAALAVLAVGIVFDVRPAPWLWRAVGIAAVGLLAATYGLVRIEVVKVPFAARWVDLGAGGLLITALWLALMSGLFGRAGTIPGVPAGVATLAGLTFYAIHRLRPDLTSPLGGYFAIMLAGICLPQVLLAKYLRLGPATAGGYVIGFLVGVASIWGALKNTAFLVAVAPLIIVGAPLLAAVYMYAADLRSGRRAIMRLARLRHLHEVLLQQGYMPRQVLGLILAGTGYLCALSIALVYLVEVSYLVKMTIILLAGLGGLVLFYIGLRMMRRPFPEGGGPRPEAVSILGVRLHAVTMQGALAEAADYIREDTPHMIVTSDASGIVRAHDDPEFRDIVNRADLVTPDGAGVVLSARLLNIPLQARCAGCDMVEGLCRVAAELGREVFLLGAGPGVAQMACERLKERVPGLQCAGCQDGYFTPEDEPGIIERIRRAHPAVLFVALGIPRQEKWINEHMAELGVPVCVGVGGSFDVISGLKKRAPVWMQRTGLEWLYRVVKEPSRVARLTALPRIVFLTFGELLRAPEYVDQPPAPGPHPPDGH